jgi:Protein of unknown function (DUF4239)
VVKYVATCGDLKAVPKVHAFQDCNEKKLRRRRDGGTVNIVLAVFLVVVSTTIGIVAMLWVRRKAPDGSYFHDGDRAAGVFGVLATGFAVLIGFVVFLAFTSYDSARAGAESEARLVEQQIETAQLFPLSVSGELTAELQCYARSVAGVQWERMENGTLGDDLNPWSTRLFETLKRADPKTATEQAAYSRWLDERSEREEARSDRVHGATGVIPAPLWAVLFFTSALMFVYMLFFADRGERAITQALLMGTVVAVIVSLLLLLQFLDDPFHKGIGGLRPVAMQRALKVIDQELTPAQRQIPLPCDGRGNAL